MHIDPTDPGLALPQLSDQSTVEILGFLEAVLQLFETRYAGQIRRFYDSLSEHNIVDTHLPASTDDPPF